MGQLEHAASGAMLAFALVAVDPTLGGVLIAGARGSGKSALAQAGARLWPAKAPHRTLPAGVTEDRLIGGIDLEATLAGGAPRYQRGLLAEADGGVVVADGVNRAGDTVTTALALALSDGLVRIERDGFSVQEPARFALLVTIDPEDGDPPPALADRLALWTRTEINLTIEQRAALTRFALSATPLNLPYNSTEIEAARRWLPAVTLPDAALGQLAAAAEAFGVVSDRALCFAAASARAAAALRASRTVEDNDLRVAVELVLAPRATRTPPDQQPPPQQPPHSKPDQVPDADAAESEDDTRPGAGTTAEDHVIPPEWINLPELLGWREPVRLPTSASGRRDDAPSDRRGRQIGTRPWARQPGRIAVVPTLRAAAPWQRLRGGGPGQPVRLRRGDLHIRRFRMKTGMLVVLTVDASGSMAMNRMRQAKGAALRVLERAYVHRDRVAVVTFQGHVARLVLPPTNSVQRARRLLTGLPTGGGTPLASALRLVLEVERKAKCSSTTQTALILISDGRANVPRPNDDADVQDQVRRLASAVRAAGIRSVLLDSSERFTPEGGARSLAAALGASYLALRSIGPARLGDAVLAATEAARPH